MKITIIDYGAGNVKNVAFALQRLGYKAVLSNDEAEIRASDKVIFPGVGEASSAMQKLKDAGLDTVIPALVQPVLGICLGMQLLCRHTAENDTQGLAVFTTDVLKFSSEEKVPQIGWNAINDLRSPLFEGISEGEYMYLVHSYYVPECPEMIASTEYGISYASAVQKDNFYGVQFHPEKSGNQGERILQNFLEL